MLMLCKKCNQMNERKVCRKCSIEKLVYSFEHGKMDFTTADFKEIVRYYTINPKKAAIEIPVELRVLAFQNRAARREAIRYADWGK